MTQPNTFPSAGGTYILLLRLVPTKRIRVGKRGIFTFTTGWYAYVGSAFGPGGLKARLGRHCRRKKKKRWHIDYLLAYASVEQIWYSIHPQPLEHLWAQAVAQFEGALIPIPRFGSSDCSCKTHLYFFDHPPGIETMKAYLKQRQPDEADPYAIEICFV